MNNDSGERELCGYHNVTKDDYGNVIYEYDNTGFDYLVITNWALTNPMDILDSGVCVQECPTPENSLSIVCKEGEADCPTSAEEVEL